MAGHRASVPTVGIAAALALLAALLVAAPPPAAAQGGGGPLEIVKDDELPSNAELAVRLSEATPLPAPSRVLISRDDQFADALASGVMQDQSPLLLVPRSGQIPDRVIAEIQRLGAGEATILGGTQAVEPDVAAQLQSLGLAVDRYAGDSRITTAIQIAQAEAPDADTIILARAFASEASANQTQAFADALSAGAMAAENRWPVLLTDTAALSPATRDYIAQSPATEVLIVGGTAAVSEAVEQALQGLGKTTRRVAGASRAETAVEVAKELGFDSAADASQVVLVDGTSPNGFAGGFAAAAHAAFYDAPILLVDGVMVPDATQDFLEPGAAFAQRDPVQITCVVHPLACDGGREDLGLVDFPLLEVSPPINSAVSPGQQITIELGPPAEGAFLDIEVKGTCFDGARTVTTDADGRVALPLSSAPQLPSCSVEVVYGTGVDLIQQGFSYVTDGPGRGEGIDIASDILTYGTTVTDTPLYLTDTISCSGPAGDVTAQGSAFEAKLLDPATFAVSSWAVSSIPVTALPGDSCSVTAALPTGIDPASVQWGLYSWSDAGLRNPLLLGRGTTASFTFADLGMELTDVDVVWIIPITDPSIGVPPAPVDPETPSGRVFNPEGLDVVCGGVPLEVGFNAPGAGASCTAANPFADAAPVLVVQPGRALEPTSSASFATTQTPELTGVYTVAPTGAGSGSCADAPEIFFGFQEFWGTTPSQPVGYHLFEGSAGEDVRFRGDDPYYPPDPSFPSEFSNLDPVLTVFGPDGSLLATNDDDATGNGTRFNSRIDLVLPQDGLYCLVVEGYGGGTGDYLLAADPQPAFVETGTLAPGEVLSYDLTVTEGDYVVLDLRAPGFETTDPYLEVYAPDGSFFGFSDDEGGSYNSRFELAVDQTGTWRVEISTFDDLGGPYLLEAGFTTIERSFQDVGGPSPTMAPRPRG